jgi:hypothetical protein
MLGAGLLGLGAGCTVGSLIWGTSRRRDCEFLTTPVYRGKVVGTSAYGNGVDEAGDSKSPYVFQGTVESSVDVGGLLMSGAQFLSGKKDLGLATLGRSVGERYTSSKVHRDTPLKVASEGGDLLVFPQFASTFKHLQYTTVAKLSEPAGTDQSKTVYGFGKIVTKEVREGTEVVVMDRVRELSLPSPTQPVILKLGTSVEVQSLGDFNVSLVQAKTNAASLVPEVLGVMGVTSLAVGLLLTVFPRVKA